MIDWISIKDKWPKDGDVILAKGLIPEMKAKFILNGNLGFKIYLIFEDRCVESYGITFWKPCLEKNDGSRV